MQTDTENKPAMPDEQKAEFAALMQAAEGGAPVPVAPGAQAEPAAPELSKEISGALLMAIGILRPVLPSVAAMYPPEVAEAVGEAVAAVCDKHGWLQGGFMGPYKEELACLMIVGPLAWTTWEAAKEDMAAMRARNKPATERPAMVAAPVTDTAQPAGAGGVTFGEVTPA